MCVCAWCFFFINSYLFIIQARGVRFLSVPKNYYITLRAKLAKSPVKVTEDLDKLEELNILIDYGICCLHAHVHARAYYARTHVCTHTR